jgi:hypothetical protein
LSLTEDLSELISLFLIVKGFLLFVEINLSVTAERESTVTLLMSEVFFEDNSPQEKILVKNNE